MQNAQTFISGNPTAHAKRAFQNGSSSSGAGGGKGCGCHSIMAEVQQVQRIFIIRHGERLDNVDYEWVMKAERPYDPPLTEDGTREALVAGERFKDKVG